MLDRKHSAPSPPLPAGATDCHMHVLGPFEAYPLAAARAYNVAPAPLEAHERMKRQVGLERTVLVQASGHGYDNRALLDALGRLGGLGRGVVVIPPQTRPEDLESLHAAGVRGARLNLQTLAARHGGDRAELVGAYGRLLAPLGWHLQIFAGGEALLSLEDSLSKCQAEVVIDHMGLPDAAAGVGQPGFQAVLRLLRSGRAWVKLSGADRITRSGGALRDAIPFMRALAAAAPQRLVWGSDWPNIGFHAGRQVAGDALLPHRELDCGALLEVLIEAFPDEAARRAILAGNPARLYGFAT